LAPGPTTCLDMQLQAARPGASPAWRKAPSTSTKARCRSSSSPRASCAPRPPTASAAQRSEPGFGCACRAAAANAARADPRAARPQDPNCKPKYSGMPDCVRQSVAANGLLRGPLQGFQATLLRNLPAAGVYFGTFEALKARRAARRARMPAPTPPHQRCLTRRGCCFHLHERSRRRSSCRRCRATRRPPCRSCSWRAARRASCTGCCFTHWTCSSRRCRRMRWCPRSASTAAWATPRPACGPRAAWRASTRASRPACCAPCPPTPSCSASWCVRRCPRRRCPRLLR